MDWSAISGIAETVSAIGVIASLLYVGYQIRENTVAAERSNARQTASDHARVILSFVENEEMADLRLRGLDDLESLSTVERYRFDLGMSVWLETIEQAFADAQIGKFSEDLLVEYRNRLALIVDTPGGRLWWTTRKSWLSPSFRNVVDRVLEEGTPEEIQSARITTST